uniref:Uncharacterized protein n=1 Tax=Rhizophora mucronata TaxID=61149 RepID=A0A2P2IY03_RHIMU
MQAENLLQFTISLTSIFNSKQ